MLFDDEIVSAVAENPIGTILKVCDIVLSHVGEPEEWRRSDYESLIECYALFAEIIDAKIIEIDPDIYWPADFEPYSNDACSQLHGFVIAVRNCTRRLKAEGDLAALRSKFKASLGKGFCYEFSQGDLEKVQIQINELRDLIGSAEGLESDHRQRLMRRLEKLQSELHKRVSDLDRFWGLIGDAGVVVGKLGENAKPVVDRIREIADIVWRTQARAEELPSGTKPPQLEHMGENDTDIA